MAQLPTGGGKTFSFSEIVRRCNNKGYRTLQVAHRKELILQSYKTLYDGFGINSGIIMSKYPADYTKIHQIASIQTLNRRSFPPNIKVIIVDEAHHATADSYRKIIDAYPDAFVLGVTATPIRSSGEGFGDIFYDLIQGPQILEMEKMGFLVPHELYSTPIDEDILRQIRLKGYDYNESDLGKVMMNYTADLYDTWEEYAFNKKTIVFAVNIAHSKSIVEMYKSKGVPAVHIDGETPGHLRDRYIKDFSEGKYLILSNVGIATEGTDIPSIECVQGVRPTKSLSLYLQMVGRGARLYPGKSKYILLDHANWFFEHGRPNANRKWTLKGTKRTKSELSKPIVKQIEITFSDGQKLITASNKIPQGLKGVKLREISATYRVAEFDHWYRKAISMRYKRAYAYYAWLEQIKNENGPIPSMAELRYIANKLGYTPGWAFVKKKELNDKFKKQLQ